MQAVENKAIEKLKYVLEPKLGTKLYREIIRDDEQERKRWITRSRDRDHPGQHGETPSLLKIQNISWARWHVPVIPATQEAEAGELPEPRRQKLQ